MEYTTKRSKVEEILIDFEDGCVVKLTDKNMLGITYDLIDNIVTGKQIGRAHV